ncbi:hypothetical protein SLEP1_g42750 [Rubroshorea leprosula]|uniref:RRM domain-containing protein n=1 Tax=Rubroshorea leprosula TaxID=152421 RepID=A0AAV5LAT6_9ROSI|nr:hypothetical protein SLEP1_g42750 [Rubroshorea leprosula]
MLLKDLGRDFQFTFFILFAITNEIKQSWKSCSKSLRAPLGNFLLSVSFCKNHGINGNKPGKFLAGALCSQELARGKSLTTIPPRHIRTDHQQPIVSDAVSEIPVIDMQSLRSEGSMEAELAKLDFACGELGFFQRSQLLTQSFARMIPSQEVKSNPKKKMRMRERNPRVRNYQPLLPVAPAAKGNHQPHLERERKPNPDQPRHFHPLRGSIQETERTVGERRRGQGASAHGYGKGILEQSTSFFFTNFPEDWQIGEMWKAFIRCGKVIQIYIARKRDKWGRRFGFARFLDVKSTRELEIKLNQIFVGDQYIKANIAIFSREETKLKRKEINDAGIRKEVKSVKSYANALKGDSGVQDKGKMNNSSIPNKVWQSKEAMNAKQQIGHGLEVQVDKEDEEWLERCFIGKAKCLEIISFLQERFTMEGYFAAKVTPMGGNLLLLLSEDPDDFKYLVDEGRDWLAQWFTEIHPWSPFEAWPRFDGTHWLGFHRTQACWVRCWVPLNPMLGFDAQHAWVPPNAACLDEEGKADVGFLSVDEDEEGIGAGFDFEPNSR